MTGVQTCALPIFDYENGLQKVCFHGDVTAVMYAMADWFSPSDLEAPTLEYVAFHDRRSFKDKKIADVLPVVFSEIMRDVDIAVSVAHAGGVDPETSHSTIEKTVNWNTLPISSFKRHHLPGVCPGLQQRLGVKAKITVAGFMGWAFGRGPMRRRSEERRVGKECGS